MSETEFVDYYELLQLSPNADSDTIERIFRHLAKKTHPDSSHSENNGLFQRIVEAHRTLSDPECRARYDARYQDYWNSKWRIASEAGNTATFGNDRVLREQLLSLLYVQRRRSIKEPGLGELTIARLLNAPPELIEFHLWYLKAKGWMERLQSGLLAITAEGVDQVEKDRLRLMPDHLLEAPSPASESREKNAGSAEQDMIDSD